MAALELDLVHFSYAERLVLAGVSLEVGRGESVVILGPSGSGKSTVLRLIAGLEAPSAGVISLHGAVASADGRVLLEPAKRRLSLVFQDLALWPHMTCSEQLAFAGPDLERVEREALLEDVGLARLGERLPAGMSGGERQRLALARALAAKPRVLLLDEPFANLDLGLRLELRRLLVDLRRVHEVTILYVTHDLDDAFALADRVAVLNGGKILQVGTPDELYRRPANSFVAAFVGKAAIVPARIEAGTVRTPLGDFGTPRTDLDDGSELDVVVRPEDVEIVPEGITVTVTECVFAFDRYLLQTSSDGGALYVYSPFRRASGEHIQVRLRRAWPLRPAV